MALWVDMSGGQGVRESEDWGGHAEAGTKASAGAQHAGAGNWGMGGRSQQVWPGCGRPKGQLGRSETTHSVYLAMTD